VTALPPSEASAAVVSILQVGAECLAWDGMGVQARTGKESRPQ
jgi:hypothetical protein